MDLFEAMMTQKSVRRYNDEPVTDEEIESCLKAAVQAPNGANSQRWQWLVVRDREKIRRIGAWYRKAYFERYEPAMIHAYAEAEGIDPETWLARYEASGRRPGSGRHLAEHIGEAPALVMLMCVRDAKEYELRDEQGIVDIGSSYYLSLAPALQNFMLAARGLGIGTCLTTLFRVHQQEIREVCDIPDDLEIEALVPMGRPKGKFGVAPRIPAEQVTSWDTYGKRRG